MSEQQDTSAITDTPTLSANEFLLSLISPSLHLHFFQIRILSTTI